MNKSEGKVLKKKLVIWSIQRPLGRGSAVAASPKMMFTTAMTITTYTWTFLMSFTGLLSKPSALMAKAARAKGRNFMVEVHFHFLDCLSLCLWLRKLNQDKFKTKIADGSHIKESFSGGAFP